MKIISKDYTIELSVEEYRMLTHKMSHKEFVQMGKEKLRKNKKRPGRPKKMW